MEMDIRLPAQPWWTKGWRKLILPALPLAYLVYLVNAVTQSSRGSAADVGYAIAAAFGLSWLIIAAQQQTAAGPRFWGLYAALVALFIAELPFAHAAAFVMCVFITIVTVVRLQARAAPIVAAFTLAALLVPSTS